MDFRSVTSLVNEILSVSKYSKLDTMDGIALLICWHHGESFRSNFSDGSFSELYSSGEWAYHFLINTLTEEQRKLIYNNWEVVAEILFNMYILEKDIITVSEPASVLMTHLLNVETDDYFPSDPIHNPFGGDLYVAMNHEDWYIRVEDSSQNNLRFYELYLIAKGRKSCFEYYQKNPFNKENPDQTYKYMYIPGIPIGIKQYGSKYAEEYVIKALGHLEEGGRMIVALPSDSLWSDDYYELREELINSQKLKYVISFRPGSYFASSGIAMTAYVIDNNVIKERSFAYVDLTKVSLTDQNARQSVAHRIEDGDTTLVTNISFDSILGSQDYSLRTSIGDAAHKERIGVKYIKLREVLTPYKKTDVLDGTDMVPRLSGKDMHLTLPEFEIDVKEIGLAALNGRFNRIDEPVFCFHSITRNYVWFLGAQDFSSYCNNDIFLFRLASDIITPEYLCFILSEDDVVADIQSRVTGVIPRISRENLLDVLIPVPDDSSQEVSLQRIASYISELKSKLFKTSKKVTEETIEDIRDDIEDKKHLLGSYNSEIQTGLNRIVKKLRDGVVYDAHTKVFNESNIEIADFLAGLVSKSVTLGFITASIGGNIFEPVNKPLNTDLFFRDYKNDLDSDDCFRDIDVLIEIKEPNTFIMIDHKALRLILDTITNNAIMHGFSDPFYGQKCLKISLEQEPLKGVAILTVANNGNPVAEEFNDKLYASKFGKCGPTAHSGRGGNFIHKAMKYYKGEYSINTTDKDWPFIISLYIPFSHE